MNSSIRKKISHRNKLKVFWKAKSDGGQDYFDKYKALRNDVVNQLRQAKREYLENLSVEKDKKKYWRAIKYLKKLKSLIPTLKNQIDVAVTSVEKACLLNNCLALNFNNSVPALNSSDCDIFRADILSGQCPL